MSYINLNINFINFFSTNDLQNNSWVFTILWMSIIFSLFLSFMFTKSPIVSVLSLLLLSISAVFLWLFETQFLFIYLVYILAFIGAVLMLFLSVVLMLPISTIRNYNKKYMSKQILFLGFISNLDDFSYKVLNLGNNPMNYLFSSSFLLFILVLLTVFVVISSWNYFKFLRKLEVSCNNLKDKSEFNNTDFGSDLLFFIVELFVAIKQNFFIIFNYQMYNRLYPTLCKSDVLKINLSQKNSAQYGISLIKRLESNFSIFGITNFANYLETFIKNILPKNKYMDYCINLYNKLDLIYDSFVICNTKLSETKIRNINLAELSWSSYLKVNIPNETEGKYSAVSNVYSENFFTDHFIQKNSNVLPNRFFLIFNLGFFSVNFARFISFLSSQVTNINFKSFFEFDRRIIAIFHFIFISTEILFRTIISFYLFVFYIYFGSFSIKYILFNIYLYFYKFLNSKKFVSNFYGLSEVFIQSILFISIIACVLPSFLTVSIAENFNIVNTAWIHHTGLSGIKFLLYEYNSLPLILSTFVLLIALIGASTLTKK